MHSGDWNAGGGGFRRGGGAGRGPRDITAGGMAEAYQVGGGEPGYIAADPNDPDLFYSGTNNWRRRQERCRAPRAR
ncbi:MAG: hypothetical protein R2882_02825 [Gemmatimonadales bacterium]